MSIGTAFGRIAGTQAARSASKDTHHTSRETAVAAAH
jgi:hypothetical protein